MKSVLNIHERTDAEAETPILRPPDVKNWLMGKDPDPGKDWRQQEKGMTEDKLFGWHHRLGGHEFVQAPGTDNGQGSLACCSPLGCKNSDILSSWIDWLMLKLIRFKSSIEIKCLIIQALKLYEKLFLPWKEGMSMSFVSWGHSFVLFSFFWFLLIEVQCYVTGVEHGDSAFLNVYFIHKYYKVLPIFPVLYNVSLQFIFT